MFLTYFVVASLLVAVPSAPTSLEDEKGRKTHGVNVIAPINVPSASPQQPVDRGFCGLASEARSFYEYMDTPEKPNQFSMNMINAISERTKVQLIVRVGGTSLDASMYNRSQEQAIDIPKDQEGQGVPRHMKLGPSYFDAFKWSKWSADISKALGLHASSQVYQGFTLVSKTKRILHGQKPVEDWSIEDAWNKGLKDISDRIKSISMHYYQIENSKYQNHEAVLKLSLYIKYAAHFLSKQKPAIPLALAETAVAIGDGDTEPLGSTLIGVDFMLHTMSIGVNRINYRSGLNYGFNL
ncbi:hypothetical protein N7532_010184 [Penicillium argentinense]|uniref:Uncharacterized protein n=1 Tax=Penicillium argentinense TaxID=1131581 RepID=A0A9W9EP43_9EURO|nr:uncharacterized protein N7532_010184 [Penicillium argentinense]KAJ5085413.1 hypothetical protein N7532_010184 [Penicillium argentinense]